MASAYGGSRYDDDEPRRYHSVRTRPRDRDEADFVREETYIERGKGSGPRDLVYRGRDDSIEDIPRDFPPPGRRSNYDDDYSPPRRARSARSAATRRYDDYDDDRYTEYGAAGAAGYAAGRRKERQRRRDDRDYDSEYSDSPPRRNRSRSRDGDKDRRKSGIEEMLGGLGLAGVVGALTGKKDKDSDRDRDRPRDRDRSRSRDARSRSRGARSRRYSDDSRSRSRGGPHDKRRSERKWGQAAQAALVAGAVEAFRSRKEPGPWTGAKGKRIATAAIGAGGIDGLLDRDPNKKTKRHLAEAVVGGLAANRLANGPRSKSRGAARHASVSPDGRARSRSRSIIDRFRGRSQSRGPGGEEGGGGGAGALKGLAAGGALAAAGKAIYDRVRSKSRKRRSPSNSSADSYVPSRNRRRDRRRSPPSDTESAHRSRAGTDRGRGRDIDGPDPRSNSRALAAGAAGGGAGALAVGNGNGNGNGKGENGEKKRNIKHIDAGADHTDSSSTTDMERKRKSMRGKELLTAGLATIATIHAAHGVYNSMEAHEKRHKLVAEGEMSPEEARKKQTKAWVQDAAAVGIAALGIKGAFSEWKEMNEQRREIHEIEKRKRERRKKRLMRQKQEEKERHDAMMSIMDRMKDDPQAAGQMGPLMAASGAFNPPQTDQSGNPYASGGGR